MNTKPDKETYNSFIEKLKFVNILLNASNVKVNREYLSEKNTLEIEEKFRLKKKLKKSFSIECFYHITVTSEKGKVLDFTVVFEANYKTGIAITDELFDIFIQGNIQLNVHPFLREYLTNTTMRMGIPPLFLPFVKVFSSKKDNRKKNN